MRYNRAIFVVFAFAVPAIAAAQTSSINTFSPYTMYGIGDLATQGSVESKGMGGAGLGFHSPATINSLNPASYSSFGRKTFLFNVGLEGTNYYLKGKSDDGLLTRKSSFNAFNINNISLGFPLGKGIGLSLGLTPYSDVGYRIERKETNADILSSIGQVKYTYLGNGGLNQVKAGVGVSLGKGVSFGAEAIYYMGRIDRQYNVEVTPALSSGTWYSIYASDFSEISSFSGLFGVQWTPVSMRRRRLTLGAAYQLGGELRADNYRYIPSQNVSSDTVAIAPLPYDFTMPSSIAVGAHYANDRWMLAADYTFRNWGDANPTSESPNVRYVNTSGLRLGAQYIPNRTDFRHLLNRWSYRVGFRYDQYYMAIRGVRMSDRAVSLGLGVPVKTNGLTTVNLGLEFGRRGQLQNGLISANYFRISIGLSLFGEDYWFVQPKYD
jgi:hypothetical protein